jgi:hypothetical protein
MLSHSIDIPRRNTHNNAAEHWGPIGLNCQLPFPLRRPIVLVDTQHQLQSPPPSCPLVIPSLRRPLIFSSYRLIVVLPLVAPPSCCPLTPLLSCRLAPAGCCVASCRAALSSSCCAALSLYPLTALPSRRLIAPAGCCIVSRCTTLS